MICCMYILILLCIVDVYSYKMISMKNRYKINTFNLSLRNSNLQQDHDQESAKELKELEAAALEMGDEWKQMLQDKLTEWKELKDSGIKVIKLPC